LEERGFPRTLFQLLSPTSQKLKLREYDREYCLF
jgi:hypothetical protein